MILNPITVDHGSTIKNAKKIMQEYKISGLPVVNDQVVYEILLFGNLDERVLTTVP